ncbi:MAG: LPS export ABC transporter permease LptG [Aestuariivita sp.]|nr:LPS export ABC transporter permease LptG [Aestuariivita sp.]
MILYRYFAKKFLASFGATLAIILMFLMLIDLVEHYRKFDGFDVQFVQLIQLVLLNAPAQVNVILPLIMIISTIALFVTLARTSELIVTRAAGRSGLRALLAPLVIAAFIGLIAITTLNPIASITTVHMERLTELYKTGEFSTLSISDEGVWLRQGSTGGQTVIHAERYREKTKTYFDVTFIEYERDSGPVRRIFADTAMLVEGGWFLKNVKQWNLRIGSNPEDTALENQTLRFASTLTQDYIRETLGNPRGISIWDLPRTIQKLSQAGFSTRAYETWFQSELSRPLFLVAMVLIASAFTMRHSRLGGTGTVVLISLILGFGLYFIRNFALVLGESGQLPILIAAWAPAIASVLLAYGLLLHTEDG